MSLFQSPLHPLRKFWRSDSQHKASKKTKRRGAQRQNNVFGGEQLEDRVLLTIGAATLDLSNNVVFSGDSAADSVTFSVGSGGVLQHNLGGRFGFNSNVDLDSVTAGDQSRLLSDITSLTYNDSGTNDTVSFGGSNVLDFASADLTVDAGTIIINWGVSITSGDGAIGLTAARNIVLKSGSTLATVNGGINLSANASGTAVGDFIGIDADNATIQTTGTGNISLTGAGGDDADTNRHYGVYLENGSSVTSTATGLNAGTITIDGAGGDGISSNYGVYFISSGTDVAKVNVTSVDGAIAIIGQAGNVTGTGGFGVFVSNIRPIQSTGIGAHAATITIDGAGGGSNDGNLGVYLSGSTFEITSVDGDIFITGQGGGDGIVENYGKSNSGIRTWYIKSISSTGTGVYTAAITIHGIGAMDTTATRVSLSTAATRSLQAWTGTSPLPAKGGTRRAVTIGGCILSRQLHRPEQVQMRRRSRSKAPEAAAATV